MRWLPVLFVLAAGCAANADDALEVVGTARSAIVGGTASPAAQDAVVFVKYEKDDKTAAGCTGTLIAPNVVLTAAHCLEETASEDDCGELGEIRQAKHFTIATGANAGYDAPAIAQGKSIFVPKTKEQCGSDLGLILLDRDVPNAKVAAIRFRALTAQEPVVAVGYGRDGNDARTNVRMQRATTVLGVGPETIVYTRRDGSQLDLDVPNGDIATGESHCYGDSGGPLLDATGNIVAVISRGPAGADSCVDLPELYAGVSANAGFLRNAAAAAGLKLTETEIVTETDATLPTAVHSDSNDRVAKAPEAPAHAAGCAAAPGTKSLTGVLNGALLGVVLGLALVARRRRMR